MLELYCSGFLAPVLERIDPALTGIHALQPAIDVCNRIPSGVQSDSFGILSYEAPRMTLRSRLVLLILIVDAIIAERGLPEDQSCAMNITQMTWRPGQRAPWIKQQNLLPCEFLYSYASQIRPVSYTHLTLPTKRIV